MHSWFDWNGGLDGHSPYGIFATAAKVCVAQPRRIDGLAPLWRSSGAMSKSDATVDEVKPALPVRFRLGK
jgi:hypothetical protein